MATTIDVLILMGSDSDAAVMSAAGEALTEFGLTWEMTVASAHRSPARVMRLVTVISLEMPNSFNTSTAPCITGASESEPIKIRTSGIVYCPLDRRARRIGALSYVS